LFAAVADNNIIAEAISRVLQLLYSGRHIIDLYLNAIPAAGRRALFAGRGLPGAAGTGPVQQQSQIASRNASEARCRMHIDLEPERCRVEANCGIDIIDDVANADRHDRLLCHYRWARRSVRFAAERGGSQP